MGAKRNNDQPNTLRDIAKTCKRGIAVFTRGLNLTVGNGTIRSGEWAYNSKRTAVGDCIVVYHRIGVGRDLASDVYVGRVTAINPAGNGLYVYDADLLTRHRIDGITWNVFIGGGRNSVQYFEC